MPANNHSMIGKITPTVYVDRITLESKSDNGLRVLLNLVVKDKLNSRFKSTWFGNANLTKFIKIKVIQTTNEGVHDFLSARGGQGAADLTVSNSNNPLVSTEIKDIDLASPEYGAQGFSGQYTETDMDGNTITNFNYRVSFDLPEGVPGILSYFCFSYIDTTEFEKLMGINLPSNFSSLNGKVSSDLIFVTNDEEIGPELVSLTSAFYDNKNILWTGPRNKTEDGQWMTGFEYNVDTSQRLTERRVPNTKIQDFRILRQIIPEAINLSMMASASFDYGKKPIFLRNDFTDVYKNQSYFSNAWLSQDEKNNVHFVFGANILELIKYKAKFGKIINTTERSIVADIIKECKIKSFKIIRRRIKNTLSINKLGSFEYPEERFDDVNKPDDLIVSTGFDQNQKILKTTGRGSVKELGPIIAMKQSSYGDCKYFSVSDQQLKNVSHGLYQYGVEMLIEDGTIIFLKKKLKELIEGSVQLKLYLQDAAEEYNPIAQKYSPRFQARQIIKYADKPKPWEKPTIIYFIIRKALTNEDFDADLQASILTILTPAHGNLEGLRGFISVYDKMISTVQDLLGESSSLRSSQGMLASSGEVEPPSRILGTGKYPPFLDCKNWFTNISVDANKLNKNGVSYLGGTSGTSFRKIGIDEFRTIGETEMDKYNISNLENLSYLSPSYFQLENKIHRSDELTLGISDRSIAREKYQEIENSILNINLDDSVNNLDIRITKETERDPIPVIYQEYSVEKKGAVDAIPTATGKVIDPEPERANLPEPMKDFNIGKLGNQFLRGIANSFEQRSAAPSIETQRARARAGEGSPTQSRFTPTPPQIKSFAANAFLTEAVREINISSVHEINWSLIQRIEVFTGFAINDKDYKMVKAENWETLTDALYRSTDLIGTTLLCRIVPYSNQEAGIRYNNNLELPIYNKYFLLERPSILGSLEVIPPALSGIAGAFSGFGGLADQLSSATITPESIIAFSPASAPPTEEFLSDEEERERRRAHVGARGIGNLGSPGGR